MWASAQRDCCPSKYRWRPLFNAAVWLTPSGVTLPSCEIGWNMLECPKLSNRSQPFKGWSSPYYKDKNLLNSSISPTCPYNMVNFSPWKAVICWRVWGTPAYFNGSAMQGGHKYNLLGTKQYTESYRGSFCFCCIFISVYCYCYYYTPWAIKKQPTYYGRPA